MLDLRFNWLFKRRDGGYFPSPNVLLNNTRWNRCWCNKRADRKVEKEAKRNRSDTVSRFPLSFARVLRFLMNNRTAFRSASKRRPAITRARITPPKSSSSSSTFHWRERGELSEIDDQNFRPVTLVACSKR